MKIRLIVPSILIMVSFSSATRAERDASVPGAPGNNAATAMKKSSEDSGVCGYGEQQQHTDPVSNFELFDAETTFENILAESYESMDPKVLPRSIVALKERGAHRCWHKHSTFLQHLVSVHNILRLWGQGPTIGRVGLFHSAYSNSYVNLALFDPERERDYIKALVGESAEVLVHLFCIIDRQAVVVNTLLKQGYIPKDGLAVPHLRNPSEEVYLSAETLRMLVVFTMADIADQYFSFQDQLWGGGGFKGSMIIPGQDDISRHEPTTIWPGVSQPGLWMSYLSELGKLARTFRPEWRQTSIPSKDHEAIFDVPPVFDNCTKQLSVEDEASAIDLYWRVATAEIKDPDEMIETLEACILKNPWAFEPNVMLAQKLLHAGRFEAASKAAKRALELQTQWGVPYDKRLSFGAWVAWTRVLLQRASDEEAWPSNSWGVINMGMVH